MTATPDTIADLRRAARHEGVVVAELLADHLARAADEDAIDRLALALWPDANRLDRPLLRAIVESESKARRESGGCGDGLLASCVLLHRLGEPEDVFLLYDARQTNMDCGAMIDHDLLTMRLDRAEMLAFVTHRLASDGSLRAHYEGLAAAVAEAFDHPNYESLDQFDQYFASYFSA